MGGDDGEEEQLQRSVFTWVRNDAEGGKQKPHQTITATEVAEHHGCPKKLFMDYVSTEIEEADACQSLPFTLLLVASYAFMAIAHDDAATIRAVEDSIDFDIQNNANFAFAPRGYMGHKDIHDVNSHADFWSWMTKGFLPLVFQQSNSFSEGHNASDPRYQSASYAVPRKDRGFLLHYNRIVGGLRMQQERSGEGEDERPCDSLESLQPLVGVPCVHGKGYELDPEMMTARMTSNPTYITWLHVFKDYGDLDAQLELMEAQRWLDRNTRKIEIAIPVYNAELGLHTLVMVDFFFSRGGHIYKKVICLSTYADWHDQWYYGMYDAIWLACLLYILITEVIEVQRTVVSQGCAALCTEYMGFWNAIDWASVLGGLLILIMFTVSVTFRGMLNSGLEGIGELDPFQNPDRYKAETDNHMTTLELNVHYIHKLRLALAAYPLMIVFRLFKAFSAQPRLALVTKTLTLASIDLLHFMLVFCSVLLTFAISGVVLFGREVGEFTNFGRAMHSCFLLLMGAIDWDAISTIGRVEAGVWMWSFFIIVVLLMLNMILAIVMDAYAEVKEGAGNAETLVEEAVQFLARWKGVRSGELVPLETVAHAMHAMERRMKRNKATKSAAGFLGGMQSSLSLDFGKSTTKDADMELFPEDEEHGLIVTVDLLVNCVNKESKGPRMRQEQAVDLIRGAILDYHAEKKAGASMEEVLQLTRKVNYRMKKLNKFAKQTHAIREQGPVEELRWFNEDLDTYLEKVREERKANAEILTGLKKEKEELREKLATFAAKDVFPEEPIEENDEEEYDDEEVDPMMKGGGNPNMDNRSSPNVNGGYQNGAGTGLFEKRSI